MTIFLRTFLSFWIATVLIALISMGMVSMARPLARPRPYSLPLPLLRACVAYSLDAPNTNRSIQLAKKCGIVSVLDSSKTERLASVNPEVVRSVAAGVTPETPISLRPMPNGMIVAFDTLVDNTHFVGVTILPNKFSGPPLLLSWALSIAVVVCALTSLILARHFVRPIRKLQRSTESFGRGELDSRPDALLLKRNDELGDLSKTIGQMSARISGLMSSQKNFLIQVSHELGSPLTRLNVALAIARRKADPALIPELDRIQHESAELNSMVQQLLGLARLESGIEVEGQESYSLHELMEEVCFDNKLIADGTGKQLHLISSPEIQMQGYRELLKRALDNVLRNAIRFTPEGSRVEVDVLCHPGAEFVLIQVRDSGVGVQDDKLEAIFEPFVRVSSDRSGAGLGLAIAKRAVLANGGTIRALNRKEGGLLVEISLPRTSTGDMAAAEGNAMDRGLPEEV